MLGGQLGEAAYLALAQGLESTRLTARENLFEIELSLGSHTRFADEMLALAVEYPDRERLMTLAMTALHRSGRGSEALRAYDEWRNRLADELGVDPGPQAQAVHLDILRNEAGPAGLPADPDPAAAREHFTAAVPRLLPHDLPDFTGRDEEVERLLGLLAVPTAGACPSVAIVGRGGVGKSALAVHVAHRIRERYPHGQLYVDLKGFAEQPASDPGEVLSRFLRALGVDGLALPEGVEQRAALFRDLLAARRVLVILDNAGSDEQLLPLLPGGEGCGVIITSRVRLGATFGAPTVDLAAMDPPQAAALLARLVGAERIGAEPGPAAALGERCGHLPLALRVAGARLATKPHWTVAKLVEQLDGEHSRLTHLCHGPLDVRASISLSYWSLQPAAQHLLRLVGSVNLPDMPVWLASALLDTDPVTAENQLERLFDAQLMAVSGIDPAGHPRYRCHDLVQLFAREQAAAEETAADLAAARDRAFGASLYLIDASLRGLHGGYVPDPTAAGAPRWRVDAPLTADLTATPLRWFDADWQVVPALVELASATGHHGAAAALACASSELFQIRRLFDSWRAMVLCALEAVRGVGDRRREAGLRMWLGVAMTEELRVQPSLLELRRAAELFTEGGDRHGTALTRANVAMALLVVGEDAEAALVPAEEADALLAAAGDAVARAVNLRRIGRIYMGRGEHRRAEAALSRALKLCRDSGDSLGEAQALCWQGMLLLEQGRYADALVAFRAALRFPRAIGDLAGQAFCLRGVALSQAARGDTGQARQTLLEALRIVQQPRMNHSEKMLREALARLPEPATTTR